MSSLTTAEREVIRFKEKLGYGLGDMASNLVFTSMGIFLTFYYTDVIGIPAAIVGTIMLVSRVFDGVSDVLMGVVVDKTRSRHGKARPWLLWMSIPFALATILTFSVPQMDQTLQVIYIFISYNLLNLVYTAINIPYGVLNALTTRDPYQRSLLNIFRIFMANVGIILVGQIVMPLVQSFGGGRTGWQLAFTLLGVVSTVLFLITFASTKERVETDPRMREVPIKTGVKALFSNRYWVMMLAFFVSFFILVALCFSTPVFYANHVLGDSSMIGTLILGTVAPQLPALFIMPYFVKRWGKVSCCRVGLLVMAGSYLLLLTDPHNVQLAVIATIIKGIGMAPIIGSAFAMLADTIDYGEWKTGLRTEGLTYSAGSFGSKVGIGLGSAIVGWVLSLGGYVGGSETQTPDAINAIISIFVSIPCVISIGLFVLMMFYKMDKIMPRILADLDKNDGLTIGEISL
ncbi:MFS transporter [Marinobacterium sedimentorum]|uniref:MFS transporter n=1 Tax=Marinobacterium sedimentorum TaxID=2927804 RepID=UPI0020C69BA7|nr:MFS transporter [Marinobacterium sedimentorum]MCP8688705.1 MFS transporter [Marinobacterium sedimentorum]